MIQHSISRHKSPSQSQDQISEIKEIDESLEEHNLQEIDCFSSDGSFCQVQPLQADIKTPDMILSPSKRKTWDVKKKEDDTHISEFLRKNYY